MPTAVPEVLVWARETAGLSIDEAAAKLAIKSAHGIAASDRLRAFERGPDEPSRPLLLRMAKQYRRPLLAFYMSAPPRKGDRGEDFRSLPERDTTAEPLVDALVRDIRARQSIVRVVLKEDEEAQPRRFVGSRTVNDGIGGVLASVRQTLGIDLADFRAQGSPDAAFALLRSRVEAAGVFVLLAGNLGSHHTALEVSAFRGFALADPIAPFVVINDQDARSAWSFTLMHELAHLWLGATGVSGAVPENRIERFSNDVASNFLLPENEISGVGVRRNTDRKSAVNLITRFAEEILVSRSMVAYRLFRAGFLSEGMWRELVAQFDLERRQARTAQRERAREHEGGPNYYVVRRHRLGTALLRFVARNVSAGALTPTKASKVLGVKPRGVAPLLSGAVPSAQLA